MQAERRPQGNIDECIESARNLAEHIRSSKAEFGVCIRHAYRAGASLRQLARATGMSHEQIRRLASAPSACREPEQVLDVTAISDESASHRGYSPRHIS